MPIVCQPNETRQYLTIQNIIALLINLTETYFNKLRDSWKKSLSRLHISFIGGLVLLLARRATKRRAWQFSVSAVIVWAYAFAVGAESSVVRAALMFTMVALAPVLHRRAASLNALGAAALVLLVWRPGDLFDPAFQLTFLSVLAIITIAWPAFEKMRAVGSWHPTRATPHPLLCPRRWRTLSEALFWGEREWKREVERSAYHYKLYKYLSKSNAVF